MERNVNGDFRIFSFRVVVINESALPIEDPSITSCKILDGIVYPSKLVSGPASSSHRPQQGLSLQTDVEACNLRIA